MGTVVGIVVPVPGNVVGTFVDPVACSPGIVVGSVVGTAVGIVVGNVVGNVVGRVVGRVVGGRVVSPCPENIFQFHISYFYPYPLADLGFPRRCASGKDTNLLFGIIFAENCMTK